MAILTIPSDDELASFVAVYSLGPLVTARGIEAGTVNTSYAVEVDPGRRYFLRIYEEQDAAGAAREAIVLA
ncbi:MAG TPA: hypothetical protein VM580_09975, partial [Labilithrix sp.]|nr:hypothetical protein [Labilithrix sp.]